MDEIEIDKMNKILFIFYFVHFDYLKYPEIVKMSIIKMVKIFRNKLSKQPLSLIIITLLPIMENPELESSIYENIF